MRRIPAEFEKQSFIQIIFPHPQSDWAEYLEDAEENFIQIINAITAYQDCLVIAYDIDDVKSKLKASKHLYLMKALTNDTWARDCSALSIYEGKQALLLDFTFNAWGNKFEADLDNKLTQNIAHAYAVSVETIDFVLEGGAIESNGKGSLLITQECVFNPNRNTLTQNESTLRLEKELGVSNILSLKNGYLKGDDTNSHIDTLARFSDENTIVYLECKDKSDEHYEALLSMKKELEKFRDQNNKPFRLIPLPFTTAIYEEEERLPATYANFLILNEAVLLPIYNDQNDFLAIKALEKAFPHRHIIPINCSTLIRQHGSLHCVTMQFPYQINLLKDVLVKHSY